MNLNRKPNQLDMKRSVIIMLVLILSAMAHGQKKWTLEDCINYAVTGLYFYPAGVSDMAARVKPSERGELEITTLNSMYLEQNNLGVEIMGRGYAWLDTGTMESLLEASEFVHMIEKRQGMKISAPEEIAYRHGWIDREKLFACAEKYGKSPYGKHLHAVADEKIVK